MRGLYFKGGKKARERDLQIFNSIEAFLNSRPGSSKNISNFQLMRLMKKELKKLSKPTNAHSSSVHN